MDENDLDEFGALNRIGVCLEQAEEAHRTGGIEAFGLAMYDLGVALSHARVCGFEDAARIGLAKKRRGREFQQQHFGVRSDQDRKHEDYARRVDAKILENDFSVRKACWHVRNDLKICGEKVAEGTIREWHGKLGKVKPGASRR